MPPIRVSNLPSVHSSSRGAAVIRAIVVHATAGTDSRAWLQENPAKVSAHVLIAKDGTIYRMVPDLRAAHHAGFSQYTHAGMTYRGAEVNATTLGLEIENRNDGIDPYPAAQRAAVAWQLATWRRTYGHLPIFRHADIDTHGKTDPRGLTVQDIEQWIAAIDHDIWAGWGDRFPLETDRRDWAIPQAWFADRGQLGEARSPEIWIVPGYRSIQSFQAGDIIYHKLLDKAVIHRAAQEVP